MSEDRTAQFKDREVNPDGEQPPGFISAKEATRRLIAGFRILLDIDPDTRPVEVMAVPRCETCRWWTGERNIKDPQRIVVPGECRRHLDGEAPEPFWTESVHDDRSGTDAWARIFTERHHGCIEWRANSHE